MLFTVEDFKAVCHSRATGVALLTVAKPQFKVMVCTEHSAAFPKRKDGEVFVTAIVTALSATLTGMRESGFFAINYLRQSQRPLAQRIYGLRTSKHVKKSHIHHVPYLPGANAALICSLSDTLELGEDNVLVVGSVLGFHLHKRPGKPLVNFDETWCGVGGPFVNVEHPSYGTNDRLTQK
jgi:flavin reductase (DIM6/NTAB) family NADH-FMN oxidoreductase RutF